MGAQVVGDLLEGLVEAALVDVEAFAAGLLGEGDEGVLAAEVAAGAGLDGHVDERVDHDFVALGLLERLGIVVFIAGGVVAVGDDDEDLAALLGARALGAEVDGIVERGGFAAVSSLEAAIDALEVVGEGDELG